MSKPLFLVSKAKAENWLCSRRIFFILSIGRSGTRFLSGLLDKSPQAVVMHEPERKDFKAYKRAFHSAVEAEKYITLFRLKNIYTRIRKMNPQTYGEVNSVLRRHCQALKKAMPEAHILHLIRDGRDMVRSAMSRATLTEKDPNTQGISPMPDDPWFRKWPDMTRFERICWYWDVENRYLNCQINKSIQFEKLISDYQYFNSHILKPLHLDIPKDLWEGETPSPKNITREHKFPHWTEWDQEKTDAFRQICGETMSKNGYKI